MKKYSKYLYRIIPVILTFIIIGTTVFGVNADFTKVTADKSGTGYATVSKVTSSAWATIALVAQFLSVAAVVFAGLRYMLASADTKADIKKQMIILVLGAALVFGAATIVQIIGKTAVEVLPAT